MPTVLVCGSLLGGLLLLLLLLFESRCHIVVLDVRVPSPSDRNSDFSFDELRQQDCSVVRPSYCSTREIARFFALGSIPRSSGTHRNMDEFTREEVWGGRPTDL